MKTLGFLIGTDYYSAEHGQLPNASDYPSKFIASEEEALKEFEELKLKDKEWGYGSQIAYISPIKADGTIGLKEYSADALIKKIRKED